MSKDQSEVKMKALIYDLSIPKYIFAKAYHLLSKGKLPAIFPNLKFVKNCPKPTLNSENWVLVKSLMSGICGSDQNMLMGNESFSMEPYASFPCVMGHENVSEILEVGPSVKNFKVGDRVIVNPVMGCRVHERELCSECEKGLDALCLHFGDDSGLGAGMSLGYHKATGGGWSNIYQAHSSQLYKISKDIPLSRAVLADPLSSVIQPIAEYANGEREEKTVLIYGAGTIGLLAVAAIRMLDLPWKIILGYRYKFQGELGKELGADHIISTGSNFLNNIVELTDSKIKNVSIGKPVIEGGVDVVFDCVGSASTIDNSLRICKTQGHVVMIATGHNLKGVDATPIWFREVKFLGTCMSRVVIDPRDGSKKNVYDIVCNELPHLEIEKLVTHTFPLDQFKVALRKSMNKKDGPVVKVAFDLSL